MSRSVCVPFHAVAVAYVASSFEDTWEWDDFLDDLRGLIISKYPSFEEEDSWYGREEMSILYNRHADVVVSEYCGLVSVSLVPRDPCDDLSSLAEAWCARVASNFEKLINESYSTAVRKIATFSNGEALYEKVNK